MSCAPHVPLPDVPAEAADAEDEGGDVPGRLEDLPVRTGAAAGGGERDQSDDLEELSEFHVNGLLEVLF